MRASLTDGAVGPTDSRLDVLAADVNLTRALSPPAQRRITDAGGRATSPHAPHRACHPSGRAYYFVYAIVVLCNHCPRDARRLRRGAAGRAAAGDAGGAAAHAE